MVCKVSHIEGVKCVYYHLRDEKIKLKLVKKRLSEITCQCTLVPIDHRHKDCDILSAEERLIFMDKNLHNRQQNKN